MEVRGYVESNARAFIGDLKQWLTIPSISADPARHVAAAFREYVAAHTPDELAADPR